MTNCPHCGTTMPTPTGRQTRRRYCSDRCRKTAWRRRHPHTRRLTGTVPDVVDVLPEIVDVVSVPVANVVPDNVDVVATASRDDVATPGGQHRCPHCRQPLGVISVIVPAAAVRVSVPELRHA